MQERLADRRETKRAVGCALAAVFEGDSTPSVHW